MIKKVLITLGSILVILILLAGVYFMMMKSVIDKMTPVKTGLVTDNIYAIQDDYVNVYLIRSDSGYILIDGGKDQEAIKEGLDELKIDASQITAIFLTHSDADHVAAIPLSPRAGLYISKHEEQMINGKTSRFFIFGNNLESKNYNLLEDSQIVQFPGLTLKAIHTPGHTPGAMCYLANGKYLFTGDILKLNSGKVEEFHHFINMDTETDILSINKISQLQEVEYIFTAHYGFSEDFTSAFADWDR